MKSLKIALLGAGKTGSHVEKIAKDQHHHVEIFNRQNPLRDNLNKEGFDGIISFLPGEAFLSYVPQLISLGLPVVTGSTGFTWHADQIREIQEKKLLWVTSHNFSLGMNVVRLMIEKMAALKTLMPQFSAHIHEVHHTKKLDSPSGTALRWDEWFGGQTTITASREGDVVGFHQLTFQSESERITLSHEALNREIFARGALWALEVLISDHEVLERKLWDFNLLVRNKLAIL